MGTVNAYQGPDATSVYGQGGQVGRGDSVPTGCVPAGPGGHSWRPPVVEPSVPEAPNAGPECSPQVCPQVKKNGEPCKGTLTSTGFCVGHSPRGV